MDSVQDPGNSVNLLRLSRQFRRARAGPFNKVEAWARGRYLSRALLATEPPRSSGWGEGRGVACVAISDGRVASARCDGVASVWDSGASLSTWRHVASFAHDDAVMAVAMRARYVATGCRDGCVRVWSIDAPATPYLAFDAHDGGVFALGWTGPARPDEFAERRARVSSTGAGAPPSSTFLGEPTELAESRLLSGGADRTVRRWDTGTTSIVSWAHVLLEHLLQAAGQGNELPFVAVVAERRVGALERYAHEQV